MLLDTGVLSGWSLSDFTPPASYSPWLLLTLIAYCVVIQFVKVWYIRRFKMWL
jgi:hypothetical protein